MSEMRSMARRVLAGRRILVVEDEYFIADDLRRALNEQNADVLGPVPTTAEALKVISESDSIDCAVLDVNLGGKSVLPILAALTERSIPFLFATGCGRGQIPANFDGVPRLEKPFISSELIAALETIIPAPGP